VGLLAVREALDSGLLIHLTRPLLRGMRGSADVRGPARPCSGMPPAYSDEKVANRKVRVWHGRQKLVFERESPTCTGWRCGPWWIDSARWHVAGLPTQRVLHLATTRGCRSRPEWTPLWASRARASNRGSVMQRAAWVLWIENLTVPPFKKLLAQPWGLGSLRGRTTQREACWVQHGQLV
jgi:hypothetical protein